MVVLKYEQWSEENEVKTMWLELKTKAQVTQSSPLKKRDCIAKVFCKHKIKLTVYSGSPRGRIRMIGWSFDATVNRSPDLPHGRHEHYHCLYMI